MCWIFFACVFNWPASPESFLALHFFFIKKLYFLNSSVYLKKSSVGFICSYVASNLVFILKMAFYFLFLSVCVYFAEDFRLQGGRIHSPRPPPTLFAGFVLLFEQIGLFLFLPPPTFPFFSPSLMICNL